MTDEEIRIQTNTNYFFTAINLVSVTITLVHLDIHWTIMGSGLTLFMMGQAVLVYNRFSVVFVDYIVVMILVQIFVFIPRY